MFAYIVRTVKILPGRHVLPLAGAVSQPFSFLGLGFLGKFDLGIHHFSNWITERRASWFSLCL